MIHQKSTCIPQNESPYNDHLMCIRSFLFFCVGPHNYSNYFYSRSSTHTHTHTRTAVSHPAAGFSPGPYRRRTPAPDRPSVRVTKCGQRVGESSL
jgi:hypothetical protein